MYSCRTVLCPSIRPFKLFPHSYSGLVLVCSRSVSKSASVNVPGRVRLTESTENVHTCGHLTVFSSHGTKKKEHGATEGNPDEYCETVRRRKLDTDQAASKGSHFNLLYRASMERSTRLLPSKQPLLSCFIAINHPHSTFPVWHGWHAEAQYLSSTVGVHDFKKVCSYHTHFNLFGKEMAPILRVSMYLVWCSSWAPSPCRLEEINNPHKIYNPIKSFLSRLLHDVLHVLPDWNLADSFSRV